MADEAGSLGRWGLSKGCSSGLAKQDCGPHDSWNMVVYKHQSGAYYPFYRNDFAYVSKSSGRIRYQYILSVKTTRAVIGRKYPRVTAGVRSLAVP